MKVIVNNIKLPLDAGTEELKNSALKKLKISLKDLDDFKILKQSVDARRKPDIYFVYSVMVGLSGNRKVPSDNDIRVVDTQPEENIFPGNEKMNGRPVIVGSGPAGLFAGLILAEKGYKPLILERGECVEKRSVIVKEYWTRGMLNPETNVQFGEGGAGTFSDGKLTTRINDRRCDKVLEEFFKSGAPEEITYRAKPHIGSDILETVVKNMRKRIEEYGGTVSFNSKLTGLKINNGKVCGIEINNGIEQPADLLILAIGHSARDTFKMLHENQVEFVQKPFSIGVRIEHPQDLIDRSQYGNMAGHPKLGAAEYQLFYKTGERTVYSFCMCPGGLVVASASEADTVVTNGMSEFARNRPNANSALVVSVGPKDFGGNHPLAGIEFQRKWERLAFEAGGRTGAAPVQRLEDFIHGVSTKGLGSVKPSYTGEIRMSDINGCLPDFVTNPMKESIDYFDRKLKGFGMKDSILTGVETRTSSPVRINRDDSLQAIGIKGLYPAGEGAGYAGGIVSAAVDGIRIAEQIIKTYALPE